jgi:hypothetical protein
MARVAHVRARARQKKPKAAISQRKDEVRNLKSTLIGFFHQRRRTITDAERNIASDIMNSGMPANDRPSGLPSAVRQMLPCDQN